QDPVPRQALDVGVAGGPRDGPRPRPALQRHDHVRRDRDLAVLGTAPARGARAAGPHWWVHRVRAPPLRAHGHPAVPQGRSEEGADLQRGPPHARRRAPRLRRGDRQRPGLLGEAWRGGLEARALGRGQRPRGHAHGREHLARRGRRARPAHGRRRAPRDRGPARPYAPAAHHALRDGRTPVYATGRRAADELVPDLQLSRQQRDLVVSMFETLVGMARVDSDLLDLKIVDTALKEMTEAFEVFRPWRAVRKVTMFGSARTAPDDPIYVLARELAHRLAEEGWMIVTGAGPGIMAAGTEGAGRD